MPRRSSSERRSSSRSRASYTPRSNPPKPAARDRTPPPTPVQSSNESQMRRFGASIAEGFAVGIGRAIARDVMDAVSGPRARNGTVASSPLPAASKPEANSCGNACSEQSVAFQDCLTNNKNDISNCQIYMDMLQECRKCSGAALDA